MLCCCCLLCLFVRVFCFRVASLLCLGASLLWLAWLQLRFPSLPNQPRCCCCRLNPPEAKQQQRKQHKQTGRAIAAGSRAATRGRRGEARAAPASARRRYSTAAPAHQPHSPTTDHRRSCSDNKADSAAKEWWDDRK